jgi:hypothetical protein
MNAIEKLAFCVCGLAFLAVIFRLNVRFFSATKRFPWLPMQRSHISRALFDRQLANTFAIEIISLIIIAIVLIHILPPLPPLPPRLR